MSFSMSGQKHPLTKMGRCKIQNTDGKVSIQISDADSKIITAIALTMSMPIIKAAILVVATNSIMDEPSMIFFPMVRDIINNHGRQHNQENQNQNTAEHAKSSLGNCQQQQQCQQ